MDSTDHFIFHLEHREGKPLPMVYLLTADRKVASYQPDCPPSASLRHFEANR